MPPSDLPPNSLFPDSHQILSHLAPRTPMQSPDLWRDPQNRRTPDPPIPFLSPSMASAETHRPEPHRVFCSERTPLSMHLPPMSPHKCLRGMPSKARGEFSLPFRKDCLLSLSLAKNDPHSDFAHAFDPALHRTGHLPLHNAPALPGLSKVLAAERSIGCYGKDNQAFQCHNKLFDSAISPVFPGSHALPFPDAADRESSMAAFSGTCNSVDNDCKSISDADASTSVCSPLPGEVAYDAFKLYSQMFPTASSATSRICSSASDPSALVVPRNGIHFHPEAPGHQMMPDIRDHPDSGVDAHKRIKYTPVKEEKIFLEVKEEPYAEQFATPYNGTMSCEAPRQHTGLQFLNPASEYKNAARGSLGRAANVNPIHGDLQKAFTSSCASAQMSKTSSMEVLPDEPSVPLSLQPSAMLQDVRAVKTSANGNFSLDADWGKFLALSATPVGDAGQIDPENTLPPFQKRFTELQAFLKQCDEADQTNCIQTLRSLTAAARNGYAVDLETRAIRLSLEEGKEMKRMKMINVLGKVRGQTPEDLGATPHGPKLPAPGIVTKSTNAP